MPTRPDSFWAGFLDRWGYPAPRAAVERALALMAEERARFVGMLRSTSDEEWDALTNCAPWRVRHIAAHLASGDDAQRLSVERGQRGDLAEVFDRAERMRHTDELAARPKDDLLAVVERSGAGFDGLLASLSDEQLERRATHRIGPNPAWWFAPHRLIEVWLHTWDVGQSLGRPPELRLEVARFLLPVMAEINLPGFFNRGPGGRLTFSLQAADAPALAWTVDARPDGLEVRLGREAAEVSLRGIAPDLCLLLYGRLDPLAASEDRLQVSGDREKLPELKRILAGP